MTNEQGVKPVALVTGATRGIGHAIAQQLASTGYQVVGTATSAEGVHSINHALSSFGGCGLLLDVCDQESVDQLLDEIQSRFEAPTVLVNNAGITRDQLLMRMKPEDWDAVIDTNLTSVYRLSRRVVRAMLKKRHGRIVNVASIVGVTGNPGQVNYVAAKAGMIGFTKALALEVAHCGITVNAVAPGFIQTDMTHGLTDAQKEGLLARIPARSMGQVADVAHAVAYLVADAAGYVTGQTLHVNGGMCMV